MSSVARTRVDSRVVSLRSEWNRAFAVLIAVVLVSGLASLSGSRLLLHRSEAGANQVEAQAGVSAQLRTDLVAQSIMLASPVNPAARSQIRTTEARIVNEYSTELRLEPSESAKEYLRQSQAGWGRILAAFGPLAHPKSVKVRAAAVTTNAPLALTRLEQAGAAGGVVLRTKLTSTQRLDRYALAALALLDLLTIALAVRLGRRLSRQVLRPVSRLRAAANRLEKGELDHRVNLERNDELGELARSFNAMADAVAGSQRILSQEAKTDSLSGLPNRAAFRAHVQTALDRPDRRGGQEAVLFVDLDDFKDVNDTLGHSAGDELLRVAARRLSAAVRPGDTVARLGGDEFAVLLVNLDGPDRALSVATRMVAALSEPVAVADAWVHVGASVGIALRRTESTLEQLMHQADLAMYTAKGKGKNRAEQYDGDVDDQAALRSRLKADVGRAVALD